MKVHCKHCNRYLFTATGDVMIDEMPCPACGAKSNFRITLAVQAVKHTSEEQPPKVKKQLDN